jgi:hypothetical protein
VFGRRRRREDVEARNALTEALARLEQGLEEQARRHAVTDATVQDLHSTVVETRSDLIKSVEYLYSVCSRLIERTESEQLERQALMGALRELARPAAIELDPAGVRVVGGSFATSPAETVDVGGQGEPARPRWA